MKIAFITPSMFMAGGIERVVTLQANYWCEEGHNVVILTHNNSSCSSFYQLSPNVQIVYVGETSAFVRRMLAIPVVGKVIDILARRKQFKAALRFEAPDIIISTMHGIENFFLSYINNKVPTIGVNHVTTSFRKGVMCSRKVSKMKILLSYYLQLINFKRYSAIVALSKSEHMIYQRLGCNSIFVPNPSSFNVCDISSLTERKKRIIMVGRIEYLKGQDRLIDAWKCLSDLHNYWELMIVGDGDNYDILCEEVVNSNLSDSLKIVKTTDSVQELMLSSSIFAFSSRNESFGMVILEAFACGLPVVSYDCDNGPRDMVVDNYNGYLIPEDNTIQFANKLRAIMMDNNLRLKLAQGAMETVSKYSINAVMPLWNNVFQQVVK